MLKKTIQAFYQEPIQIPAHTTQADIFYQSWHLGPAKP